MSGSRNGPENRAALRWADELRERCRRFLANRCPDPACCNPATSTLGPHAPPAEPTPAARELLVDARASLAAPITNTPERDRAGKE